MRFVPVLGLQVPTLGHHSRVRGPLASLDDRVDPEEIRLTPGNIAIALGTPWESLTTTDQV